jgi:hypothetical protein
MHGIHSRMDAMVAVVVMLNMLVMAINYDGMGDYFHGILDTLNNTFLAMFAVEMVFKNIGLGMQRYWKSRNNFFDGSIVVGSCLLILLANLFPSLTAAQQVGHRGRQGVCGWRW